MTLPRVFRASDGSVAVQDLSPRGFHNDFYEVVRVGKDLAEEGVQLGHMVTGEMLSRLISPWWTEMVPRR
jgi:hypothetical protein